MALRKRTQQERGNVLVLVAVSLVALLGFAALVVDVGYLYWVRANLQNACDAAALAGVRCLPDNVGGNLSDSAGSAVQYAQEYAYRNVPADTGAAFMSTVTESNSKLTVNGSRPVNLFFARIFGQEQATVQARAVAVAGGIGRVGMGVIPVGLQNGDFSPGDSIDLKLYGSTGLSGNCYALNLESLNSLTPGGGGADGYRRYLQEGYPDPVNVGDTVFTETGTMAQPTYQGLIDRVGQEVIVPVVSFQDVNGTTQLTVLGFAVIKIEVVLRPNEVDQQGWQVQASFVRMVEGGEVGGADYGYSSYRLVQ